MNEKEIINKIKKDTENLSVPPSLLPEQVEEKLRDARQKNFRLYRNPKSVFAAAACLFVIIATGIAIYPGMIKNRSEDAAVENKPSSVTYAQVCTLINEYTESHSNEMTEKSVAMAENDSNGMTGKSSADASDYSETDRQVDSIAEGDIVKTDGSYIYTVKYTTTGSRISIYRANGGSTAQISHITLSEIDCRELYLDKNRLILIGESWNPSDDTLTNIFVYDLNNPEKPKKIAKQTQSGDFNTSRISNGYLYTFSNHLIDSRQYKSENPKEFIPQVNNRTIKEKDIDLINDSGSDEFLVMTSLSLDSPGDFTDTLTTLGGGDVYYMNDANIYVTQLNYDQLVSSGQKTGISRYSYSGGKFNYQAHTQIRGRIANSYYMHEYEGNFCFVYTLYLKNGNSTNGLCIMDKELNLLGELSDLGVGEQIYSSYYRDNMAYFVTYRETDPVFAVDISNPKKPVLKSKLKLPGFSSYLHSFGEGNLLGIGELEDKVKFSLFTFGKNQKITETTKKIWGEESYCIADENHRAVLVDEKRGLFALGISLTNKDIYVIYRYSNGRFEKVLTHTVHSDIDNVRGVRIGEIFYVVDVYHSITAYDMHTWKKL